MQTDYDDYFERVGITDENDKKVALDFVEALFNITIETINNQLNK